ncbi:MAG: leucine-rich repeat domain-containing protein [Muribaculaceae bacterium]|nr:leucine-rich repeat domain-containing protein [Muribaculaceae bacterium]
MLCSTVLSSAQQFSVDVLNYTVLSADDLTVSVSGHAENLPDELVIPSTVTYEGTEYTVTELGRTSLMNTSITGIVLPSTLTKLGYGCLRNSKITSITLPSSVSTIDSYAMSLCILTSIIIEDGDQPISIYPYSLPFDDYYLYLGRNPLYYNSDGELADPYWDETPFSMSSGLKDLEIGPEVTEFPAESFLNSPYLESVVIQPGKLKSISSRLFSQNKKFKEVVLPETLTEIESSAFNGCIALTGITIPNSVTTLGASAFNGCTSLKYASLPSDIETIPTQLFYKCNLSSIVIPGDVSSIGYNAFVGCPLAEIRCQPIVPPSVDVYTFNDYSNPYDYSGTLYVREGCEEAYRTAKVWKNFADIQTTDIFTSVDGIRADDGPVRVYNLNGACVMEGEASTIGSLSAGIYIVERSTGETSKIIIR